MGLFNLFIGICLFVLCVTGEIPMFILLFGSAFIVLWSLMILMSKDRKLTNLGRFGFIVSLFGLVYSIPEIFFNVDMYQILFRK